MAKSTAKAEAILRDLKDKLEFRGFVVSESKDAQGWPKLNLNGDYKERVYTFTIWLRCFNLMLIH